MAYVRVGLDAHIQDNIKARIHSSFTLFNPLFYFLGLSTPDGRNDLGRPQSSTVYGGAYKTKAQIDQVLGSQDHQVRFVKSEPNDGGTVSFGGATKTASAFAEDNFGTARVRWTHIQEPMKIRGHSLLFARGDTAIRAVLDDSMAPVWERFVKRINQGFWTDTLTLAQQANTVWPGWMGIDHQLTTNNVFGSVDRSVETALNPLLLNASTQLPTTVVDLDITRKVNVGFTDELSADITGLTGKSSNGEGATTWITTAALWQELASQAEGRYQIFEDGMPDAAVAGFKFPIIKKDNSLITYDPYCPSGTMFGLNLSTWMIEIQRGYNFVWNGFTRKDKSEEGGEFYEWGNFELIGRLTCTDPWLNCQVINLTTS